MKIAEIFYSIQGEGILAGVPSVFIRSTGCNLRCTWCDTPYTSWNPEGREIALDEIVREVETQPATHVVVTGGEPMIAEGIVALTWRLKSLGLHVTVETAGTVSSANSRTKPGVVPDQGISEHPGVVRGQGTSAPPGVVRDQGISGHLGVVGGQGTSEHPGVVRDQGISGHLGVVGGQGTSAQPGVVRGQGEAQHVACDLMSISPKLANSTPHERDGGRWAAQHDRLRYQPEVLKDLIRAYEYQLKFVVSSPQDLLEIQTIVAATGADRSRVMLMAEGVDSCVIRERAQWIAEICKRECFRYSPRLHIDLWGDRRGV